MRDLIYRQLAQLLIQSRGAYGVELARKRAVASRLMGDEAESRDWTRVRRDAEQLLKENGRAPIAATLSLVDEKAPVLILKM